MDSREVSKVSIVMCTFNGEKHLGEQLDTILSQTYPIHEIIIQDDRSTDQTMSILREYQSLHPHIHVYQNETQKGINKNFFSAMERASGDYVALSDQDDLWMLDKIERQLSWIKENMLCAGVTNPFSDEEGVFIDEDTRVPNVSLERTIHVPMVAGHTMMFRKELINKIPRLDFWIDNLIYDHLIQIVASCYNSFVFLPEVLVKHRRLLTSATYTKPLNYDKSIWNIFPTIKRTLINYRSLRPQMKTYFMSIHTLLKDIEYSSPEKENAMLLVKYRTSNRFPDYIRLSFLCVKLRDRIFHAKGGSGFLSIMRALYFPISCSDYFRYLK